jgi:hypothetical protein
MLFALYAILYALCAMLFALYAMLYALCAMLLTPLTFNF